MFTCELQINYGGVSCLFVKLRLFYDRTVMQRTVIHLLRTAATRFPDASYLNEKRDSGWTSCSFHEALTKSGWFASSLLDQGFAVNDKVAVLAEGRADWVITEYGVLRIGGIMVPLSIKLLPDEIQFRLEHSDCKAIIVSSNTLEKTLNSLKGAMRKNIRIIYLDSDLEDQLERLMPEGISRSQFLFAHQLYDQGRQSFERNLAQLEEIERQIAENQVVTISYTSGTTGNPKGIMLTHLNYYSNSADAMQYFDVSVGDRLMIILPLDHSFAHTVGIYACAVKGLSIHFVDARGGGANALKNIPINLKEVNPHMMLTVPALTGNFMNKMREGVNTKGSIIRKLFEAGLKAGIEMNGNGFERTKWIGIRKWIAYKLACLLIFKKMQLVFGKNLRYCVGGGALLDLSQQQFFSAIGVPVYQGYGLTEATPIISANNPKVHKYGTSGMVIPNLECKIIDSDGVEVPQGTKGQIVIRGNNVMKGYYRNPSATEAAIKDGWLFTGDLGYFDSDGFLVVIGREKALLISASGEKYSPEGIEEAIVNTAELITQVMVYNDMKPYTVAVAVLAEEKVKKLLKQQQISEKEELITLVASDIRKFTQHEAYANQFPEVWVPRQFVLATEPFTEQNLMINSTMKMVRHKVLETYKEPIEALYRSDNGNSIHQHNYQTISALFGV